MMRSSVSMFSPHSCSLASSINTDLCHPIILWPPIIPVPPVSAGHRQISILSHTKRPSRNLSTTVSQQNAWWSREFQFLNGFLKNSKRLCPAKIWVFPKKDAWFCSPVARSDAAPFLKSHKYSRTSYPKTIM